MAASVSRRAFLTKASVGVAGGLAAGVAATSGLSLASVLAAAPASSEKAAGPDLTPLGRDVVAHLRDASSGEISLLVGKREIVYHDPELAGRILSGVRRAGTEV